MVRPSSPVGHVVALPEVLKVLPVPDQDGVAVDGRGLLTSSSSSHLLGPGGGGTGGGLKKINSFCVK